ncbi:hypothetical protein CRE_08685 [Caenorhabditis remanei]|uniref:Uncharacterized protein n=1 Tax=Caenorhabditis remanei TaxID=31234 RepID=E3LJD1_CAERE|nr:hypothetical protein CRE_08685 [Caenorhabditis remanei]
MLIPFTSNIENDEIMKITYHNETLNNGLGPDLSKFRNFHSPIENKIARASRFPGLNSILPTWARLLSFTTIGLIVVLSTGLSCYCCYRFFRKSTTNQAVPPPRERRGRIQEQDRPIVYRNRSPRRDSVENNLIDNNSEQAIELEYIPSNHAEEDDNLLEAQGDPDVPDEAEPADDEDQDQAGPARN